MLHNTPDFLHRAQIVELMDEPCSREQLRACLRDIARTNQWTMAYRPLIDWLNALLPLLRLLEPSLMRTAICSLAYKMQCRFGRSHWQYLRFRMDTLPVYQPVSGV